MSKLEKSNKTKIAKARREKVSYLQTTNKKVDFCVIADIHFSLNPPIFRSKETNWIQAQSFALSQVIKLCNKHRCPLLIAGDIFHKWDEKPEAIISLMKLFSEMNHNIYAIPGNHDVPNHAASLLKTTAYGVLVESGKIKTLQPDKPITNGLGEWTLWGFPIGTPQKQIFGKKHVISDKPKTIALIHDYCWMDGRGFPGAPPEKYYKHYLQQNKNFYDIMCFGDNHSGFIHHSNKSGTLVNCGGLTIRNSDEVTRRPFATLIYNNMEVEPYYLNTEGDIYDADLIEDAKQYGIDEKIANEMLEAAEKLGETFTDFRQVVFNLIKSSTVQDTVKNIIKTWINQVTK